MTFFGALGTAVQGINAQATAIGHISDNVANATTTGYKQVNTIFGDMVMNKVLGDSPVIDSNKHMGVGADAKSNARKQGQIVQDRANTTSMAISGQGFFPVSKATGVDPVTHEPTGFENAVYYTRLGDFHLDNSNRLVNSAGYYLRAVALQPGQAAPANAVPTDFVIDTSDIAAVPTSNVFYSINLPATALPGKEIVTGIGVVDGASEEQNFQLIWTKTGTDTWDLNINTTQATPNNFGPISYTFVNGIPSTATTADPNVTGIPNGAVSALTFGVTVDYGSGPQTINVNMGTAGQISTAGQSLTQFAGETREASNISIDQNGLKGGQFEYITLGDNGSVVYNYTNGRSAIGANVMLANFREPEELDRLDGTTFIQTSRSGNVAYGIPGSGANGVGDMLGGALEQSTVDVAEQLTKLMVAQQAYSMNGQVITAADQMLSRLVDLKR